MIRSVVNILGQLQDYNCAGGTCDFAAKASLMQWFRRNPNDARGESLARTGEPKHAKSHPPQQRLGHGCGLLPCRHRRCTDRQRPVQLHRNRCDPWPIRGECGGGAPHLCAALEVYSEGRPKTRPTFTPLQFGLRSPPNAGGRWKLIRAVIRFGSWQIRIAQFQPGTCRGADNSLAKTTFAEFRHGILTASAADEGFFRFLKMELIWLVQKARWFIR